MTELEKVIDQKVTALCERDFDFFLNAVMSTARAINAPEGLPEKIESLIKENKHLFYRNYGKRLKDFVLQSVEDSLKKKAPVIVQSSTPMLDYCFDDLKNRTFLEAYLQSGESVRGAAERLKVPKSTFFDWLSRHRELVEAEKNKTRGSNAH